MFPQRSHITRKRHAYYYRRRLPRPWAGEVSVPLRTRNFRLAEHLGRLADEAFAKLIGRLAGMHDIKAIVRQHLATMLEEDRQRHLDTPPGRPVYVPLSEWDDTDLSPQEADRFTTWDMLDRVREARASREVATVATDCALLMGAHGVPDAQRREVESALLDAFVRFAEIAHDRAKNGVSYSELSSIPAAPSSIPAAPTAPTATVEPERVAQRTTPRMSEVLEPFIKQSMAERRWRKQTESQNRATYKLLLEVCGDLHVELYGKREIAELVRIMRDLPPLYSKAAEWRDRPVKEVAAANAAEGGARLAPKTMRRHLSALGSLFEHLIDSNCHAGPNPAHKQRTGRSARAKTKRDKWSGDELRALFGSPVWQGSQSAGRRASPGDQIIRDERYWLPLLAVYQGSRLEELAQLVRADVKTEGGIVYFDINDRGNGKQLKNEQSVRRVPLHPELIRLGFIDYVHEHARSENDRLFPNLKPGGADNKRGHSFTKWFTRYRTAIGIYRLGLDYHSFRHTWITRQANLHGESAAIKQLVGHDGTDTTTGTYTKELELTTLYEVLRTLSYPELDGLLKPP